ncbi:MAG: sugar kinase [Elusimicrobia bacterium RIFOXYD2_FULL_34_15]|nr:MAG: sugar kinase [Elusimicrobia bacterium RIFOXYD2_FULL_34_15]
MSILVVGSVALDSIKTPLGEKTDILGGSATYFSYSASFFTKVNLVAVVGNDFPKEHIKLLESRKINTEGLQTVKGNTFRWSGCYENDMNEAKTLSTCLNVFETFKPEIPESYKNIEYVFLANIDPDLQMEVLSQMKKPKLIAADSMNLWIKIKKPSLTKLLSKIDILIINDGEARLFTEQPSLIKAGKIILDYGLKYVVIKKGEHGSLLFSKDGFFAAPAYPLEEVFDPTGAGDTFAGGFFGYLAKLNKKPTDNDLRRAVVHGSVMASFNVEDFSLERLKTLTSKEIETRYKKFKDITNFK